MSMLRSKLYEYELEKKRAITKKIEDSKLGHRFRLADPFLCFAALPHGEGSSHKEESATWIACWMVISSPSFVPICRCAAGKSLRERPSTNAEVRPALR